MAEIDSQDAIIRKKIAPCILSGQVFQAGSVGLDDEVLAARAQSLRLQVIRTEGVKPTYYIALDATRTDVEQQAAQDLFAYVGHPQQHFIKHVKSQYPAFPSRFPNMRIFIESIPGLTLQRDKITAIPIDEAAVGLLLRCLPRNLTVDNFIQSKALDSVLSKHLPKVTAIKYILNKHQYAPGAPTIPSQDASKDASKDAPAPKDSGQATKTLQRPAPYPWKICPQWRDAKCYKGAKCFRKHGDPDTRDYPERPEFTTQLQQLALIKKSNEGNAKSSATAEGIKMEPTTKPAPAPTMAPLPTSVQVPVVASPTKLSTEVKSVQAQRVVPIQPGKTSYELINKEERAIAAVQELSTADIVAVDMEGINLGRNGKLCLIQITARSKKLPQAPIYLFSVLECPAVVEILRPLLESDTTVKILHDSRQDTAALNSYGINLSPVKDTQRIFDMLHILKRVSKADPSWRDKTLYSGVGAIGLNTFLGAMNQPQNVLKTEMKKCHDKWDQVPLPAKMLEYAASDVIHLIDAYSVMDTELQLALGAAQGRLSALYSRMAIREQELGANATLIPPMRSNGKVFRLTFDEGRKPLRHIEYTHDEDLVGPSGAPPVPPKGEVESVLKLLPTLVGNEVAKMVAKYEGNPLVEFFVDKGCSPVLVFRDRTRLDLEQLGPTQSMIPYLSALLYSKQVEQGEVARKGLSQSVIPYLATLLKSKQLEKGVLEEGWEKELDSYFTGDNRMGINGTLHRISCKRDRRGNIDGLTYRIGRHIPGCSHIISDVIGNLAPRGGIEERHSLLLMGRPGTGKTTLLREIASALASPEFKQLVMVVDTSNEIAGDSDIPHTAIGRARRMQVPFRDRQHEQMIESVQNHNPDVIEIDEIGTSDEVQAARTISQRGVSLIATAHGGSFVAALRNTVLRPLFGGIQAVILSASEAKIDHNPTGASRPRKTVLERKEDPTFRYLIELVASNHLRIYHNIQEAVDSTLKDDPVLVEERWVGPEGKIYGRYAWVEAPKDASSALMHDFEAAFATIQ